MSILSKLLGRSGGDGDPDKPMVVGAVPNASESVGGAQTETIGAGQTINVGRPVAGDEVLVAFEHGDVRNGADPDGGGEATGDPFAVKIEHVVPPEPAGHGDELSENVSMNFAKFEGLPGDGVATPGDLAAGADPSESSGEYYIVKTDILPDDEDLAAGGESSETPGNVYLKMEEIVGSEPAGDGVLTGGGVGTAEAPAGADDGSIPTETLSLNFDKITLHDAPGGPGVNELAMDDTAGAEPASGDPVARYHIENAWPSKLDEDPDGGGPIGELAKKAAGDQEYLEVKLENVQITSYQLGVLDSNGEDPDGGGPDALGGDLGPMMKESAEEGGVDMNIGLGESLGPGPGFGGGIRVAAGDVDAAPGESTHSEFSIKKFTDATSHGVVEDDDEGSTLESLAVQEPGTISGAIGGVAGDEADDVPDLDDLDLDDDGDGDL